MGYAARNRGTFEERKAQSLHREEVRRACAERKRELAEANMAPEERRGRAKLASALLAATAIAGPEVLRQGSKE